MRYKELRDTIKTLEKQLALATGGLKEIGDHYISPDIIETWPHEKLKQEHDCITRLAKRTLATVRTN